MIDFILAIIEIYIHKAAGQRLRELYRQYRGWWIILLLIAGLIVLFSISIPWLDSLVISLKQISEILK